MRKEVMELLVQSEDTFRREVRNVPVIAMAYRLGIEEDLTVGQMALLALGPLLLENQRLLASVRLPAMFTTDRII